MSSRKPTSIPQLPLKTSSSLTEMSKTARELYIPPASARTVKNRPSSAPSNRAVTMRRQPRDVTKARIVERKQNKEEEILAQGRIPLLHERMDVKKFTGQFSDEISKHIQQNICSKEDTKQYILGDSVNYILTIREQSGGAGSVPITYEAPDKASVNAEDIMKIPFSGNVAPAGYKANVICTGSSPEGIYLCILLKILIPDLEVAILKESDPNGTHKLSDPAMVFVKMLHTFGFDMKTKKNAVTQGAMCDGEELSDKMYSGNVRGGVLNIFPSCFYSSKDAKEYKKIFKTQAENENVAIQMNMLEYFLTRRAQELGILVLHSGVKASLQKEATKYTSEDTIALFDSSKMDWAFNGESSKIYYAYGKNAIAPGVKLPKQSGYDNLSGNKYGFYFASKNKLTVDSNLTKYVKPKPDIKESSLVDICNVSSIRDVNGVKIISVGPALRSNHVLNSGFGYYGFADAYIFAMLFKKVYGINKMDPNEPPPPPLSPPLQQTSAPPVVTPVNETVLPPLPPPVLPPPPPTTLVQPIKPIQPINAPSETILLPPPPPGPTATEQEKPVELDDVGIKIVEETKPDEIRPAEELEKSDDSVAPLVTPVSATLTIEANEEKPEETPQEMQDEVISPAAKPVNATLTIEATEKPSLQTEAQKEERNQATLTIEATETPVIQTETQKEERNQSTLTIEATEKPSLQTEAQKEERNQATLTIEASETPVIQTETQKEERNQATLTIEASETPVIQTEAQKEELKKATLTIEATETPVIQTEAQKEELKKATLTIEATDTPMIQDEAQKEELKKATLTIEATETPMIQDEAQKEEQTEAVLLNEATETPEEIQVAEPVIKETATKEEIKEKPSFFSGMFGCTQGALDQSLSKKLQEERDRENMKNASSDSGVNPVAADQQSSNKEEVMKTLNELKEEIVNPSKNLSNGVSAFASGLVKGTAGLFSKISSATTAKLTTVPYEMLNPDIKYLSIYINPGIEFVPKMLNKYSTSNSVQFNPLVRYSERVINSIPEGRPRTDIYEKLFNNQAFKVMLAETMSSLFGAQTKKTIKQSMDAGIVDDNITTTLNTLFATGNVLYINDAPYTVYSYTWNGEWQIDTKVPNSFEYMVHPYQREGLFKYDEMQQEAARKQLEKLPKEILMSKKLQQRLEEPEEKDVEAEAETPGDTFLSKIVDAIKPTVKSSQVRVIDKATVPQGTPKAGVRAVNASLRRYKAFMPNDTNKWDVEVDPYVFTLCFTDRDQLQEFIRTSKSAGLQEKYAEVDASRTLYTSLSDDYNNALQQITLNNTEISTQLGVLAIRLKDVPNSVGPLIETALDKLGLRDKINNQDNSSEFITFLSDHVSKQIGALVQHTSKMPLYKCDKVGLLNNMFERVNKDIQKAINELVGKEAWEEMSKTSDADTSKLEEFTKAIELLQTSGANVITLRESLIADTNNSEVATELTDAQTAYNKTFMELQENQLLMKPWISMVDAICATEFQKMKSANGNAPVFAVNYKDKSITARLAELSKLKPFEMIALVDSVTQMFMAEQMENANAISKLYVEQTNAQNTLTELLGKKGKCTKDYYNKLSEFLTLLRSAIDKKDARINTLTTAMDADINMCKRVASLPSVKTQEEQAPLAYGDAYAMELIVVYSKCDASVVDSLKTDIKMRTLKREMDLNTEFWKCISDSSQVFDNVVNSVNTDVNNAQKRQEKKIQQEKKRQQEKGKEPVKEEEPEQFEYEAMLIKIKMSEIVNLQKIQLLSQQLYSIELGLYIDKHQEEKRKNCSNDSICINTDTALLNKTSIWVELKQSCALLSGDSRANSFKKGIEQKTVIIKQLSGIIGNFNKSLLNVFDSNKDSKVEPVESKVKMLCNAVATNNEQLVVPTLDEFFKTDWARNAIVTRLFQLHIVSSVFAYMKKKGTPFTDILSVKSIENVNFWDVYEKTQETGSPILDAVATILNSELYLTSSTIVSSSCPYFQDGQFDFSEANNSEGVADLKNALNKQKSLNVKLNVLQQVFKIQFTVVELIYDNVKETHKMNIFGCNLELTKEEESFKSEDVSKVEYCAFMILYKGKYYIPYNYKIGSFLYKKADLKKVSINYLLMEGCNVTKGVSPSIFRYDQKGGAEEDNKAVVQAQPVIAQAEPVIAQVQSVKTNASNYRIKMENTKESKLSYYIAVDLKLVPGKTLNLTDKLKMACEMNADNVRKDLSRLFGFVYVPKPPLIYTATKQDTTAKTTQPPQSATSWMQTKLPDLIREKNYSQVIGDDFVNLMKTKIHTSEKFKYAFMNLAIASNEYNEILKTHRISTEELNNLITEAKYLPVTGGSQSRRANKRATRGTRKVRV